MTQITFRELADEERLAVMYRLNSYAFHASPPLSDEAAWRERVKYRQGVAYWAVFEDDQPVAGAAGRAMTQQARGKLYPMSGIWAVATIPAARRKGYCRQVMARLLASLRDQGAVFSCLYPFRESFYERLGYVAFPQERLVKFSPAALLPLLKQKQSGECVPMLIADGIAIYQNQLRQLRQRIHGMALFDDEPHITQSTTWLLLAKVNGEIAGFMLYALRGEHPTQFTMNVYRFYYHTGQGRYLLLEWLARHVDQAKMVEITLPAFELPETWLADLEIRSETIAMPPPMGRVLDVAKIGGMTTGAGHFSARVVDPLCPWNEGNWRFETVDGVLQVETAQQADCELSIQALSALVYGAHDPGDFSCRGWGNPSPELQAVLRTMFPPRLPYLHEMF